MQPIKKPLALGLDLDGRRELVLGAWILFYGLVKWVELTSPKGSIGGGAILLFFITQLIIFNSDRAKAAIRKGLGFAPAGCVDSTSCEDARPAPNTLPLAILLFAAIVAIYACLARPNNLDWFTAGAGLLIAEVHSFAIGRHRRWKALIAMFLAASALVLAALPTAPAARPSDFTLGFAFVHAFAGITMLLSGGFTCWQYRRSHPLRTLEQR